MTDPTSSAAISGAMSSAVKIPSLDSGTPAAPTKRSWRPLRWLAALLILVMVFGIVGFFVVPPIAKAKVEEILGAELGRIVRVGKVELNPYTLRLAVHDVAIEDLNGRPPLLAFDRLEAEGSWTSITQRVPVLRSITLTKPRINIIRFTDDRFNFTDILEKQAKKPPADGPVPRFSLNNIRVIDGHIDADNRVEQTKHVVERLEIGIPFISSLPVAVEINVDPKLTALVDSHPLNI